MRAENIVTTNSISVENFALSMGSDIRNNVVLNTDNEAVKVIDSIAIYEHICEKDGRKWVLTLNLVGTTPAHLKGWELVQKRELMTVGVSLGNRYFSKDRLEVILLGMASYFEEVLIIVPDLPALHTYRALGYDEYHAMEKVKKHRHEIERCHRRVSEQAHFYLGKENISVLMWSDAFAQQEYYYQQAYDRAMEIYRNNFEFKESIMHNTERYILARLEEQNVQQLGGIRKIVEKAARYLIEEMAFHELFSAILGREPIASYYRDLELITNHINGNYGNPQNKHLGWIVYNIVDSE